MQVSATLVKLGDKRERERERERGERERERGERISLPLCGIGLTPIV